MQKSPPDRPHQRADLLAVEAPLGQRYESDELDLAVLEAERSIETEHRVQFFPISEELVTPPVGTIVAMIGHPRDLAKRVAPGVAASFSSIQWSKIEENPKFIDFNPVTEFATKFMTVDKVQHARGFSGAGMWFDKPTIGVWHPNLGLAGVAAHYYARSKVISALRIETVIGFLRSIPVTKEQSNVNR
jgi:hypothetical protein